MPWDLAVGSDLHGLGESGEVEELGIEEWLGTSDAETDRLLDPDAGVDVRWKPDTGWTRAKDE